MVAPADRLLLIGSVPLPDTEQVFRRLGSELGPYLARLPDGETGERGRWIYFQRIMLETHPAMELDTVSPPLTLYQWDGKLVREAPYIRFKRDVDLDVVRFDTGYDRAAREACASRSACRPRSPARTCMSARVTAPSICGSTSATCSPRCGAS